MCMGSKVGPEVVLSLAHLTMLSIPLVKKCYRNCKDTVTYVVEQSERRFLAFLGDR